MPELRQPVVRDPGEVAFRCISIDCPAQALERLLHWASRGALDIDGMGEEIVSRLVESGRVGRTWPTTTRFPKKSWRAWTWAA